MILGFLAICLRLVNLTLCDYHISSSGTAVKSERSRLPEPRYSSWFEPSTSNPMRSSCQPLEDDVRK